MLLLVNQPQDCSGTSTDVLRALAAHCPSLTHLDLGGAYGVDDAGLHALAAAPFAGSLRALNLYGCNQLDSSESLLSLLLATAYHNRQAGSSSSSNFGIPLPSLDRLMHECMRCTSRTQLRALLRPLEGRSSLESINLSSSTLISLIILSH